MRFRNRIDAGQALAARLDEFVGRSDVIVLALPRGGVPVASEVARHLGVPLDVFLVRKIGVPGHPELAMGAVAEGGIEVLSDRSEERPTASWARYSARRRADPGLPRPRQ